MTIQSTLNRTTYGTSGGAQTQDFTLPFTLFQISDLVVQLRSGSGPTYQYAVVPYYATQGGHTGLYITNVRGIGSPSSRFTLALDTGNISAGLVIYATRVPDMLQMTAYVDGSPFPAATHEMALDKLTAEVQYLNRRIDFLFTYHGFTQDIA